MTTTISPENNDYTHQSIHSEVTRRQVIGRFSVFLMIIIMLIAGFTHYHNMEAFPAYQDTEGTNIANAWSMVNENRLAPYTYAYENPPTGTFLLAGWAVALGGSDTLGFSLNAGRLLMLAFHILSVALVFAIARKISGSNLAAIAAALIFSLSPLALSIQRRVLLDNMMLTLLLAAFYNTVGDRESLYHYVFSAMLFGVAVLFHTDAIIFLPAMIYTVYLTAHKKHRRFAITLWSSFAFLIMLLYPMYAQMRTELFPQGWYLGGDFPHVSLLERLVDRGPDTGIFLNIGSGFAASFDEWTNVAHISADPVLIYLGILAVVFIAVMAFDNKSLRPLAVITVTFIGFHLLGGQIAPTDIITLLPFLAISVGIVLAVVANLLSSILDDDSMLRPLFALLLMAGLLYPFGVFYFNRIQPYTLDQVQGQLDAVAWIQDTIPADSVVVTDNFAFVTLRETMPDVHHYWKVDTDPDVKYTLLEDDPCNIDYVITTPQVMADIEIYSLGLLDAVLDDAELLRSFENNGWPVDIWQVRHVYCPVEDEETAFLAPGVEQIDLLIDDTM